jgi:hypothetical protein
MSDTPNSRRSSAELGGEAGILASLPNSRPQRPSARRARQTDTRVAVASPSAATAKARPSKAPKPTKTPKPTTRKPRASKATVPKPSRAKRTTAGKSIQPPAPRQGFEAGSEIEQGLTVGPPSGLEVAGSVVGLLGEVAQAGVSSGGRLLKGALSRLTR